MFHNFITFEVDTEHQKVKINWKKMGIFASIFENNSDIHIK